MKTCTYYPHFCDRVGHTNARHIECRMHSKSSDERVAAKKKNEEIQIREYMEKKREGMSVH